MSNIETIEFEADEVEAGRMSLNECEYPCEVEDYLASYDFDSRGYIIKHEYNPNNFNNNFQNSNQNEKSDNGHEKTVCGICLLLFLIFWFFSWISYNQI